MSTRTASPFSLRTVLALVVFGFVAFLALLYFIGSGDTGRDTNDGRAHAASNGLNGYSGLVKLLEAKGSHVNLSRSPSGLETYDLLVLTPPPYFDAEELSEILEDRQDRGPTLVILPKWYAYGFPKRLPDEVKDKIKDGWVQLARAEAPGWPKDLASPYTLKIETEQVEDGKIADWNGIGRSGTLPTKSVLYAEYGDLHSPVVTDSAGHILVTEIMGKKDSAFYNDAHNAVFVVEPDLVNNYGLADADRAALAVQLVEYAGYDEIEAVTFDLTLNGFGGSTNLLTLAFRPPFLAATLCLMLAIIVIGWRAFRRFGPPVAEGPAIAFGKQRLISNGAGLILRANRLRLLAEPYVGLMAQRLQRRLGLARASETEIDAAIAHRLPQEIPFSQRASSMRAARSKSEILSAAAALKELEGKLTR
ncbi:DUF4350 domain-containing protein [Altererythrobacter sp.]|uniref:DUF4350 domain-containing protein n=1 Tax=Altererythrobacter sp. TaxID=1872480 RepID=UPI003D080728